MMKLPLLSISVDTKYKKGLEPLHVHLLIYYNMALLLKMFSPGCWFI